MKRVLIITYYWPPSGGSGVQRWLKMSKYMPENGWQPVIYTAEDAEYPVEDTSLAQDVAPETEVLRRPIVEPYRFYKRFLGFKTGEKVKAGFINEGATKRGWKENLSLWIRGNFFIPDARCWWVKPSVKYLKEYLKEHPLREGRPCIGVIISRSAWISGQRSIEVEMISELESNGLDVIPLITNSLHNEEMGSKNIAECITEFMMDGERPIVDALLKTVTFMVGKIPSLDQEESAKQGASFLAKLNVPVFQPIISYDLSLEDWESCDGLVNDVAWGIAMPEFEGMIEPIMLGTTRMNP